MEKLLRENVMIRRPIKVPQMPQFPINLEIGIKLPSEQLIPLFTQVLTLLFFPPHLLRQSVKRDAGN